jgi:hypothetical protein
MSSDLPTNRAEEYRNRADEARAKAEIMANDEARASMLEVAALWELMATYEANKIPPDSN